MSEIRKEKSRFIITLDDGKQTYFDFADGKIYGVSGKENIKFSNKAMQILKSNANKNFLAWYFDEITHSYDISNAKNWSVDMVETIFSLFADKYPCNTLITIAYYCYNNHYILDSKGIKAISETLKRNNEIAENAHNIWDYTFSREMDITLFPDFSAQMLELLRNCSAKKTRETIIKDAKKIDFRMEHENWLGTVNQSPLTLAGILGRYINLCNILKKEPTYKNLFLQLGYLEKEKELMQEQIIAEYQFNAPLFFEDETFITVIPTTAKEFQDEADAQSNCVFRMYYPRVKNGTTHIVFIRKKSEIDTPYITCEVDNNGKIIQYLTRFNAKVSNADALNFKANYQTFLSQKF